jgi:hypothetical protein
MNEKPDSRDILDVIEAAGSRVVEAPPRARAGAALHEHDSDEAGSPATSTRMAMIFLLDAVPR